LKTSSACTPTADIAMRLVGDFAITSYNAMSSQVRFEIKKYVFSCNLKNAKDYHNAGDVCIF
jgi:hypothetical protein